MSYLIGEDAWLHDFWGIYVSCISGIHFGQVTAGDTTRCRLGVVFASWCIVKLDFYVVFCSTILVLVVSNYIMNMGIKMISWIWGVCDVNMTS